ncbi:hypothetical protein TRICI_004855 [Trichomonascus ciferrii]|uniref:RRM domain-containing protein n=1 Tax=Trichomonascus ciferrii TaxID=44093 RepID=A0A642UY93_9ASCO|nr:hypothetical protein TRICI_004855 [Trichomonascus ciferrii]
MLFFVAGEVVFADVMTSNGRSKGCGVVEFTTVREAQEAIDMFNHRSFKGRELFIREDRASAPTTRFGGPPRGGSADYGRGRPRDRGPPPPPPPTGGYKLFVSNIPFQSSWQDLKDLFKRMGPVLRADIRTMPDGRSRGYGTVVFEYARDADEAIAAYNGWEWHGRPLEVREDRYDSGLSGGGGDRRDRDRGGDSYRGYGYRRGSGSGRGGSPPPPPPPPPPGPGDDDNEMLEDGEPLNSDFTQHASGNGYPSEIIYVDNLPWSTTNQDLVELFSTVGNVDRAEIKFLRNGKSAGVGVVKFDTPASAEIAIAKFSGYNYGNRDLKLSYVSYPEDQAMQFD